METKVKYDYSFSRDNMECKIKGGYICSNMQAAIDFEIEKIKGFCKESKIQFDLDNCSYYNISECIQNDHKCVYYTIDFGHNIKFVFSVKQIND